MLKTFDITKKLSEIFYLQGKSMSSLLIFYEYNIEERKQYFWHIIFFYFKKSKNFNQVENEGQFIQKVQ